MNETKSPVQLKGICDCHVHVFESEARYPFDPARTYTPPLATMDDLLALHAQLGVERMVIVQASPHGTDNACLLAALKERRGAARGVAVISDSISDEELQTMHEAGVRGVRANLETSGQNDPDMARSTLLRMAERVAPLGWHVQTYTNLQVFKAVADVLPSLPVPLVVDHFCKVQANQGMEQPGFAELLDAVRSGRVYVKLSAPYRCSTQEDYRDVAPFAQALIQANPERVLWGTDWPHPGTAAGPKRPPSEVTPFRKEDDMRALARCKDWATSEMHLRKMLVENPAGLYDF